MRASLGRILIVHNRYSQRGGEDLVAEAESRMLIAHGHEVHTMDSSNQGLPDAPLPRRAAAGFRAIWDREAYRDVRDQIRRCRPQVVHCHNTFPSPSPSVYYAARAEGVPVVQTLHNYRTVCVNALFYRNGRACFECVDKTPWRGVVHRCYRGSALASAAVATTIAWHRLVRTWQSRVDRFIVFTDEFRRMMVEAGLPSERISIKPNFVSPDPGCGPHRGGYALFLGRLAREKGVDTLISAWREHKTDVPLRIVGDGPLRGPVTELAAVHPQVQYMGPLAPDSVRGVLQDASILLVPSIIPEGMPLVILEAFAAGLPVLASDHPNLLEVVGEAGWFFAAGDAAALATAVRNCWEATPAREIKGAAARAKYQNHFTEEMNYLQLRRIYNAALNGSQEVE